MRRHGLHRIPVPVGQTGSGPIGRRHQRETHWRLLTQPFPPGIKRLLGQASLSTEGAYRLAARGLLLNHITPVFAARDGFV